MTKNTFDYTTFFYKMFLVFLFAAQIYCIFFQAINVFTIFVNGVLGLYLIFRFYLLVKFKKRANKLSMTLPDFLYKRNVIGEVCKKCGESC
jgi:Flp pilus assembly protein TadB